MLLLKCGDGYMAVQQKRNRDRPCRSVAAAHVRRCSRRLCGRWRRCCDRGLTRCGRARRWLARAGNQDQAHDGYGTAH